MDEKEILEQVKIRLLQYSVDPVTAEMTFTHAEENPRLSQLIKKAVSSIKKERHYENNPDYYTDDEIEKDLLRYEDNIVDFVIYYRSQAGEEFMKSYSENGVSRSWVDSKELLRGVTPLSRIV